MDDPNHRVVLLYYKFTCVHCLGRATSVHEREPRSKAPNTWRSVSNRVPLCNECHEWAQRNTDHSSPILKADAELYESVEYGGTEDRPPEW